MAAFADPAFKGVGQEPGLTLFRVEKKEIVKQPKCDGKFHTGDSYLVLSTVKNGSRLDWTIHLWIGNESSQDEYGIAAYKMVELDDSLGGAPVQYREVQGHESALFLSLFKSSGVEYLPGGVDAGFVKVERDVYRPRLLHLKGKRIVRVNEVPLARSSLTTGDVFILDLGLNLFLYNGTNANKYEKARGCEMIGRIKDEERGGRANVVFVHEDPKNSQFWDALGGFMNVVNEGEPDDVVERSAAESLKLFCMDGGSCTQKDISGGLKKAMFETHSVFLVDTGKDLYVWVGRGASPEDKKQAMPAANKFISDNGRPLHTSVVKVVESGESVQFTSLIGDWNTPKPPSFTVRSPMGSNVAKSNTTPFNASALSVKMLSGMALVDKEEKPVDDGSGKKEIWRVEDFKRVAWPEELYGQFYGGDSYIILYTYEVRNRPEYIIYFWQGKRSSTDEKGASALLAKELDDSMGGAPVQVRVVQGKEPVHFRSMFDCMVVHKGGHPSGFTKVSAGPAEDENDNDGISLYHVKGTCKADTYGVEVPCEAASLNSGDTFVLLTPSKVMLWSGRNCMEDEVDVATTIAKSLISHSGINGREFVTMLESAETDEFWQALGGKGSYAETREKEAVPMDPRLFQVSNSTGALSVEEVANFDQEDLCDDDVMILDTFTNVYVWIGSGCNETEDKESINIAQNYIETATDGRDKDTPITKISAGREPSFFTMHFRGWDATLFQSKQFVDPFEAKMKAIKAAQEAKNADVPDAPGTVTIEKVKELSKPVVRPSSPRGNKSVKHRTYEELKGYGKVIEGVDSTKKEEYLEPGEFNEVFGMSPSEFAGMPKWKQVAAKKKADLF